MKVDVAVGEFEADKQAGKLERDIGEFSGARDI